MRVAGLAGLSSSGRSKCWSRIEPGSRHRCSPVPLLAGRCNARDTSWRHFLRSRALANVDVAGSIPVSCSISPVVPGA